ncbi:MAG TPA: 6-phosphogluconolactonase [Gemmatimonadales bacterium]|nr:6-phosphogluconolactonase [Gemmatimonadales bacterium]
MTGRIEVLATADALAHAAAGRFVLAAHAAIETSGRFAVALSGGSTPRAFYTLLATEPYASRVEWPRVQWFWSDERCVPPDAAASNYRMAREALLDRVPVAAASIHRIHGEDDPTEAAAAYERTLRETFATPAGARFDLVLLGMGVDGHTASLFPGGSAVRERQRWVMAEYVKSVSMWRVTLTPVVINAAADVAFVVAGREKATMLHRVLEGPYRPDALPAQVVAPSDGHARWLVDAAAAGELSEEVRKERG